MSLRVYDAIVRLPLKIGGKGDGSQPIRDLDTVRGFLSGAGPSALFDLPWMPVYLAICFLFHPYIGLTALAGAIILVVLTVATELKTRHPTRSATQFAMARNALLEASRRNAEAITAMGMVGRISRRWGDLNRNYIAASGHASDVVGGLGAMSKVLRLLLQSSILAVGAWLVIHRNPRRASSSPARSLAAARSRRSIWRSPIGAASSAHGKAGIACRDCSDTCRRGPIRCRSSRRSRCWSCRMRRSVRRASKSRLPGCEFHPRSRQGARRDRPDRVGEIFAGAHAGRGLDAGARQRPARRRDARPMVAGGARPAHRLSAAGRRIVPGQRGAEHRAVRGPARIPEAVLAAAQAAGVHDLIVNLPEGYETNVGDHGSALSAGQAQRIALARALYRDPFLVVLDEPNSNLDAEGDEALTRAILGVRARGAIVIVVAHRPSAIAGVDYILVMAKGRQQQFGPKEEILNRITQASSAPPRTLKVVPGEGGAG